MIDKHGRKFFLVCLSVAVYSVVVLAYLGYGLNQSVDFEVLTEACSDPLYWLGVTLSAGLGAFGAQDFGKGRAPRTPPGAP